GNQELAGRGLGVSRLLGQWQQLWKSTVAFVSEGGESCTGDLSLFFYFALYLQLLGLLLIGNGANNLIDHLYSWDIVGNPRSGGIELIEGITCFGAEILYF
uniref:Uncharacterized protein n=1 Tax=Romanomermis culicivorax TaxID=13658 RepID=A0A915L6W0_ROMCU